MVTCKVVEDLLPSYIENLTSDETAEEVRQHLAKCDECRAIYNEMVNDDGWLIEKAVEARTSNYRRLMRRIRVTTLIGAAVVLIFVFSLWVISTAYNSHHSRLNITIESDIRNFKPIRILDQLRGFTGSDYEDIKLLNNMISLNFDKYGSIFDLNFEIAAQKDGAEYWYKIQENSPYNLDIVYEGKMKGEYSNITLSAVMNALDKVQWKRIFEEGISPDYYSVRFIENPIRVEGTNTRILLYGGPDAVQYYVSKDGEVTDLKDVSSVPAESHVVLIVVTPMYNDGNGSSGTGKFFYYVETE